MTVTLIADDLTGACDAGALFSGRGPVGVFVDAAAVTPGWEVAALDTESRALGPEAAGRRVRDAVRCLAARLSAGHVFKKIDSTLRGPVAAEVESLLDEAGRPTALVCPAFPGQGRTVTCGLLLVDGVPAHQSSIGRDPAYPAATSDVREILGRGARRSVRHLPLDCVRRGREAMSAALAEAAGGIVAADAETDADLDALAGAAAEIPRLVLAGSAGLAAALAARLGHAGPPAPLPRGGAWLVVAGSLHPATRAQVRAIEAAGIAGAVVDETGRVDAQRLGDELRGGRPVYLTTAAAPGPAPEARRGTAAGLAAAAAAVLRQSRPAVVAVTGGETARALMCALRAERLELSGAPATGLALGDLVVDGAPPVPWLTKAGGFGPPDLFLALLGGAG